MFNFDFGTIVELFQSILPCFVTILEEFLSGFLEGGLPGA